MRPPLFVLCLAFVGTVLIASVDALRCYYGVGGDYRPQDCDELARELDRRYNNPPGTTRATECATMVMTSHGESADAKGCLAGFECGSTFRVPNHPEFGLVSVRCTTRCKSDLCNGDPSNRNAPQTGRNVPPPGGTAMSTTPMPLLIAIVASTIAALGI